MFRGTPFVPEFSGFSGIGPHPRRRPLGAGRPNRGGPLICPARLSCGPLVLPSGDLIVGAGVLPARRLFAARPQYPVRNQRGRASEARDAQTERQTWPRAARPVTPSAPGPLGWPLALSPCSAGPPLVERDRPHFEWAGGSRKKASGEGPPSLSFFTDPWLWGDQAVPAVTSPFGLVAKTLPTPAGGALRAAVAARPSGDGPPTAIPAKTSKAHANRGVVSRVLSVPGVRGPPGSRPGRPSWAAGRRLASCSAPSGAPAPRPRHPHDIVGVTLDTPPKRGIWCVCGGAAMRRHDRMRLQPEPIQTPGRWHLATTASQAGARIGPHILQGEERAPMKLSPLAWIRSALRILRMLGNLATMLEDDQLWRAPYQSTPGEHWTVNLQQEYTRRNGTPQQKE